MKLTIGILFCDKDVQYTKDLVEIIKERVHIPYELVFFDNRRADNTVDISYLNEYTVLNTGKGNAMQVEGRRAIIKAAKGDYVWFIDADDEPLDIDEGALDLLEKSYDIYMFNFKKDQINEIFDYHDIHCDDCDGHSIHLCREDWLLEAEEGKNLCVRDSYTHATKALWNKWIKTSILRDAITLIPEGQKISASEDFMLFLAALKFSKTEYFNTRYIYLFNTQRGNSVLTDYTGKFDRYLRCLAGVTTASHIIREFMTEEELKAMNLDDLECQDGFFFLTKVGYTKDAETRAEMLEVLERVIGREVIEQTWLHYLLSGMFFTKEEYYTLEGMLKERGYKTKLYDVITTRIVRDGKETIIEKKREVEADHHFRDSDSTK